MGPQRCVSNPVYKQVGRGTGLILKQITCIYLIVGIVDDDFYSLYFLGRVVQNRQHTEKAQKPH